MFVAEYGLQVAQQPNAETCICLSAFSQKRNSRNTRPFGPLATNRIGNGNERFLDISIAVLYLVGQGRPFDHC